MGWASTRYYISNGSAIIDSEQSKGANIVAQCYDALMAERICKYLNWSEPQKESNNESSKNGGEVNKLHPGRRRVINLYKSNAPSDVSLAVEGD